MPSSGTKDHPRRPQGSRFRFLPALALALAFAPLLPGAEPAGGSPDFQMNSPSPGPDAPAAVLSEGAVAAEPVEPDDPEAPPGEEEESTATDAPEGEEGSISDEDAMRILREHYEREAALNGEEVPEGGNDRTGIPVTVNGAEVYRRVTRSVAPLYPELCRRAHLRGVVVVRIEVDHRGIVDRVQVLSGHPLLTPGAVTAAAQWEFRPLVVSGRPSRFRACLVFQAILLLRGEQPDETDEPWRRDLYFRFDERPPETLPDPLLGLT